MRLWNDLKNLNSLTLSSLLLVRGIPALAMVLVGLDLLFHNLESVHSLCIGGAFGLLIGYSYLATQIKGVTFKEVQDSPRERQYPIS
jgi:hypothetical protein